MIENPETGALENFNFDHLLKHVPELKRFNYRISSYQFNPPIDSSDMEPAYWAKLVKIINYNYDYFDGFVILHGTDTMAYTASALSFMLENLCQRRVIERAKSIKVFCIDFGGTITTHQMIFKENAYLRNDSSAIRIFCSSDFNSSDEIFFPVCTQSSDRDESRNSFRFVNLHGWNYRNDRKPRNWCARKL